MSKQDSSSPSGVSTGNPGDRSTSFAGRPAADRSDKPNHPNDQYRKPRIHRIVGAGLALAGAAILAFSLKFFLFHPMTATDEYIGPRLWIVGSWLLGGGVTLTFARPWVAALVGFFSPALTFGMAMLLFIVLALLGPLFG